MKLRTLLRSARGPGRDAATATTPAPVGEEADRVAPDASAEPAAPTPGDPATSTEVEPAAGYRAEPAAANRVEDADAIAEEPVAVAAPAGDADGDAAPATPYVPTVSPRPATAELLARADALVSERRHLAAIDLLTDANRTERDPFLEHRLVHLRHEAFEHLDASGGPAEWPPVVPDRFAGIQGCPTIEASDLDAATLASAVTNHGCLLVRGLVDPAGVERMVTDIDRAFAASAAKVYAPVGTEHGSWFQPFRPTNGAPPVSLGHRWWVQEAGGVLAGDSPPAFFTMAEIFEEAGLREVVGGYLGERPVLSLDKCTLRRVPLGLHPPEWHQDGQFLGDGIRVLNVWLALSPCGGDRPCPGLDVVPKRFHEIVETGTHGAYLDWAVGHGQAVLQSADAPIERPLFDPGDALLFDEMFLHRTATDDTMTEERYAIESWFFAPSSYPGKNAPLVF